MEMIIVEAVYLDSPVYIVASIAARRLAVKLGYPAASVWTLRQVKQLAAATGDYVRTLDDAAALFDTSSPTVESVA